MCFIPILLLGYALTLQTDWHRTTDGQGTVVEIQTCDKGFGFEAKATTSGFYGFGGQYAWQMNTLDWDIALVPKVGTSWVDHAVYELPSRWQLELGASLQMGYRQSIVAVEYWHLSNAWTNYPNIGMDFLLLMGGIRFQ